MSNTDDNEFTFELDSEAEERLVRMISRWQKRALSAESQLEEARRALARAADAVNEAANANGISMSLRSWLRDRRNEARGTYARLIKETTHEQA